MTVSLIISTYNWPRALYLCLDSVMQQTVMPSEIIIADDGSGIATRDVVRHFEAVSPVPVRHIWHEDDGFRLGGNPQQGHCGLAAENTSSRSTAT